MGKKHCWILIVAVVFISAAGTSRALAEEMKGMPGQEDPEMHSGKMAEPGERGLMGKHPMGPMMMKAMMEKSIVATTDGGVVVLAGNKLIKFDKDLNVLKEVEIKVDMEAMQKSMKEMMKNCPLMKQGLPGAGKDENNPEQKSKD